MLKKLGKYEIIEELGRGAMGIVYKAKDPFIGRLVAMKTITASLADQPELLERFFREAQAAGQMAHPNIVTIFDMGNEGGTPFIAMEFLEGKSLEAYIDNKDEPLPLSVKLGFMLQVCRGLEYAHKRGVVHRDIKPANVVVTKDGTVKVVDFGIARVVDTSKTQTGVLMGTVGYMSPEQVRGEKVDGRSDIWSTGVMFYEFLCDRRPFIGDNFAAVMLAIITQEPRPLKEFVPDCPADLEVLLQKFLKKDVTERFQNMDEAVQEMEPLWKRLQQSQVSDLVTQGQKLVQEKNFTKARDVLRQVLQIDTAHTHARTLLEKVNAELKRELILPQIKTHLSKAEDALRDGKLDEARTESEAALKLDSVYEPAVSVMKQVEEALDRAKKLKNMLQSSQQHMAEGSLTQADMVLDKVLELSRDHPEARALKRQLATEMAKRETRQRMQETLQKARNLWTQQKFEDSIEMLRALEQEFPQEGEIKKLLETVLEDKADQQKSQHLAEARNLLASQKFDQALKVIEAVLKDHPEEHAAQKLRTHILQEQKETERRKRVEQEHALLKKLVTEEKFADAIAKGEVLLKEFPEDFELAKLLEYARTQSVQVEQAKKLGGRMNEMRALLDKKEYDQAVKVGEQALESFPGHVDLMKMTNEARTQAKEKEKREYVEKQIRSMKTSIDKGNLTDAIGLGRQTLAHVKHDTDVTRLLHFAERESELRVKETEKIKQLENATVLMSAAKFEEAVKVLKDIDKTHVFDPRVQELLKAAQEKKAPPDATVFGISGVDRAAPASTPAKDVALETQYVFRQAPATPPKAPAEEVTAKAQAAQPSVQPAPPPPPPPAAPPKIEPAKQEPVKSAPPAPPKPEMKPPAPPPPPPASKQDDKKKKKGAIVEEPVVEAKKPPLAAGPSVAPPPPSPAQAPPQKSAQPGVKAEPAPAVQPPPPPKPAPAPARVEPRVTPPPPMEEKKGGMSPAVMGGIGVAVLVVAIGAYMMFGGSKTTPPTGGGTDTTTSGGTTSGGGGAAAADAQQQKLMDDAQSLFGGGKTGEALAKLDEALKVSGGTKNADVEALKKSFAAAAGNAKLQETMKKDTDLWKQASDAFAANDFGKAEPLYKQIVGLGKGAPHGKEAAKYVSETIPNRKREEKSLTDARNMAGKGDYTGAKGLLTDVIKLSGPRKKDAEDLMAKVETELAKLGKDQLIKNMQASGVKFAQDGEYAAARKSADDIKAAGGDPSGVLTQIDRTAQTKLGQLTGQFNSNKSNKAGLSGLIPEFRKLAESGGSVANQANDYANNRIPAAISDIDKAESSALAAEAEKAEKNNYDKAVSDFNAAVRGKNKDALGGAVLSSFRILASSAKYGSEANDYISNKIPSAMKGMEWSCPRLPASPGGQLAGEFRPGMTVNYTVLEASLTWGECPQPPAHSGTVMLSVDIDESGAVVGVKPRAGTADPAIIEAVKKWKTTAGPKYKGTGVKTSIPMDLKPN